MVVAGAVGRGRWSPRRSSWSPASASPCSPAGSAPTNAEVAVSVALHRRRCTPTRPGLRRRTTDQPDETIRATRRLDVTIAARAIVGRSDHGRRRRNRDRRRPHLPPPSRLPRPSHRPLAGPLSHRPNRRPTADARSSTRLRRLHRRRPLHHRPPPHRPRPQRPPRCHHRRRRLRRPRSSASLRPVAERRAVCSTEPEPTTVPMDLDGRRIGAVGDRRCAAQRCPSGQLDACAGSGQVATLTITGPGGTDSAQVTAP